MSQPSATVVEKNLPATGKQPVLPPDERFWKRYSSHHEFPMSATTSLVLHGLVLALLLLGGYLMLKLGLGDGNRPLPIDAIAVAPGGDNGTPDGNDIPGEVGKPNVEAGQAANKSNTSTASPTEAKVDLSVPTAPQLVVPDQHGPDPRLVNDGAVNSFAQIGKEAQDKLLQGIVGNPSGPPGNDKPGPGGKKGNGPGPEGDGTGTIRTQRVQRWQLQFNTINGMDYCRQLHALGAIVAIPEEGGQYRLIRDLMKRPLDGKIEDPQSLHRIFWIDNKPESVRSLSQALGLQPPPPYIAAFFPESLEEELLSKERKFSGGKREEDIQETHFRIDLIGKKYVANVDSLILKNGRRAR